MMFAFGKPVAESSSSPGEIAVAQWGAPSPTLLPLNLEVLQRQRAEEALRRSEAYFAEAQGLTQTGSWACNVITREILHSSEVVLQDGTTKYEYGVAATRAKSQCGVVMGSVCEIFENKNFRKLEIVESHLPKKLHMRWSVAAICGSATNEDLNVAR